MLAHALDGGDLLLLATRRQQRADIMATPSISTVHAPHDDSSHPRFEPVNPKSSRNTSNSNALGSMANS